MEKFVMYNVDLQEKIGEAYDTFMCQDMLYMFWDHGIDNIQVQHIKEEEKVEE